jgi:cell division FtsZ-interacting protein ZapD
MPVAKQKVKARTEKALADEMKRLDAAIKELTEKLENPELPLSSTMRISIRQNELMAYVRGIRFAIGEEECSFDLTDPEA